MRFSSAVGFSEVAAVEKCEDGRKSRRFSTERTAGIALWKVLGVPTARIARGKRDFEARRSTELKAIYRDFD